MFLLTENRDGAEAGITVTIQRDTLMQYRKPIIIFKK